MAVEQRIARVNSGDVSLFYRVFGSPGKTPIVILHGSNYYDSYDWINVATQLATDREVVTPDRRGWGESTWSPSKDYSRDALMDDMRAVIGAMKWTEKPIIAGHSGAGPTVIAFAVDYARRALQARHRRQPDEPRRGRGRGPDRRQSAARVRDRSRPGWRASPSSTIRRGWRTTATACCTR